MIPWHIFPQFLRLYESISHHIRFPSFQASTSNVWLIVSTAEQRNVPILRTLLSDLAYILATDQRLWCLSRKASSSQIQSLLGRPNDRTTAVRKVLRKERALKTTNMTAKHGCNDVRRYREWNDFRSQSHWTLMEQESCKPHTTCMQWAFETVCRPWSCRWSFDGYSYSLPHSSQLQQTPDHPKVRSSHKKQERAARQQLLERCCMARAQTLNQVYTHHVLSAQTNGI